MRIEISEKQFEAEVRKSDQLVLVYFHLPSCAKCATWNSVADGLVKDSAGKVKLVKLNVARIRAWPASSMSSAPPASSSFGMARKSNDSLGSGSTTRTCTDISKAWPESKNEELTMNANFEKRADIAVIGLAVMGQNLILNMNDHGYTVAAYNRTVSKVDEFMAGPARGSRVIGAHSLEAMIARLKRPRRVMLMVKAGKPVDDFIALLLPHLAPGDVIIDGGNSQFTDTIRRTK